MERADFHVHYNPISYEESTRTAREAIDLASAENVTHMVLLARSQIVPYYREFIDYGRSKNVSVIPGIEHLTLLDGKKVDVICIGFDPDHPSIKDRFGKGEKRKLARIAKLQKGFLESLGFSFENLSDRDATLLETILKGDVVEKAIHLCEIVCDTKFNTDLLQRLIDENAGLWRSTKQKYFDLPGYTGDVRKQKGKFLYELLFRLDKPGFSHIVENMDDEVGSIHDVLEAIHAAGGVVLYSPEGRFSQNMWDKLTALGIDGIMAWHGGKLGHGSKEVDVPNTVIRSSLKKGLLVLGGSDYQQMDWQLGAGYGEMQISVRRAGELLDYISSRNDGKIPWEK